jgi:hypothetical protein
MKTEDATILGQFCEYVMVYRKIFNGEKLAALRTALDELLTAERPASEVIAEFLTAVRLSGDLRSMTTVPSTPVPPPQGDYACPRQACTRREHREPSGPVPFCEVYRQSMIYQP